MKRIFQLFNMILCLALCQKNAYTQQVDVTKVSGFNNNASGLGSYPYVANESIYTNEEIGNDNFTTAEAPLLYIGYKTYSVSQNSVFDSVKIYLKDVPATQIALPYDTYSTDGYTLVYDGSIQMNTTADFVSVPLLAPYIRTAGTNLQVLVVRTDNAWHAGQITARGSNGMSTIVSARVYSGSSAPTENATILNSTSARAAIRLTGFFTDARLDNTYTLGKIPPGFGNGHIIQSRITNTGVNMLNGLDVTLQISGDNTFSDVQTIDTLVPGASRTVSFAGFSPVNPGNNVITVSLPADSSNSNNTVVLNQAMTRNAFSYIEPGADIYEGYGINGATADLVAGFTTALDSVINEIRVGFVAGGNNYKLGIWDGTGSGGAPGVLLWESDSLISVEGGTLIPVPYVSVSGKFYVGVRQLDSSSVWLAYQDESPLRPSTFYFASPAGSAWTDLASEDLNTRFSIEPLFFLAQPPDCAVDLMPAYNVAPLHPDSVTSLSWASGGGAATNYDVYFGTTFPPPLIGNTTNTSYPVAVANGTYYWSVIARNDYGASSACSTVQFTAFIPSNDDAATAIPLTPGAGCTGAPYSTVNASLSATEPYPFCSGQPVTPVWFSFEAPANGAVRIRTDVGDSATLTDTKIALFAATDVNDYSTFSILSCAEDGGALYNPNGGPVYELNSILYATGLTPGTTYYIAVDKFDDYDNTGTFCITVDALDTSMLSAASDCDGSFLAPYVLPSTAAASYPGWVPLTDVNGKLVALVRSPSGGNADGFYGSQIINTSGTVRQSADGRYYMDRNFSIDNTQAGSTDVQLFFLNSELSALAEVDAAATLGAIEVIRQTGVYCPTAFNQSQGSDTTITATSSENLGNMSYVQFTTPGFSAFFLTAGTIPLPIRLRSIEARNTGLTNRVTWSTEAEDAGDYFELERSADGKEFALLSMTAGKGRGSQYVYEDEDPFAGINFYRLKLVNKDGSFTYSVTVKATLRPDGAFALEAYPNPAGKNIKVSVFGSSDGTLSVADISGKVLLQRTLEGAETELDFSEMSAGVYFIRYTDRNFSKTVKIIKQ